MPYASYCCAIEASSGTVWKNLTSRVRQSPRAGASGLQVEIAVEGPHHLRLAIPGIQLTEEWIAEAEGSQLTLRLTQGQGLHGERRFHIRSEAGRVLLESSLAWDADPSSPMVERDILPYMELLVRNLLLDVKRAAESSSAER